MLPLSDKNQADVVEAFNSSSRYLENLLNICGCGFLSDCMIVGRLSGPVAALTYGSRCLVSVWCLSVAGLALTWRGFPLAMTVYELGALYFISLWHVDLFDYFPVMVCCIRWEAATRAKLIL